MPLPYAAPFMTGLTGLLLSFGYDAVPGTQGPSPQGSRQQPQARKSVDLKGKGPAGVRAASVHIGYSRQDPERAVRKARPGNHARRVGDDGGGERPLPAAAPAHTRLLQNLQGQELLLPKWLQKSPSMALTSEHPGKARDRVPPGGSGLFPLEQGRDAFSGLTLGQGRFLDGVQLQLRPEARGAKPPPAARGAEEERWHWGRSSRRVGRWSVRKPGERGGARRGRPISRCAPAALLSAGAVGASARLCTGAHQRR
uniref:Uncharacterized protein n=1 Tax=Rangifer tarandus platyrhynchus TaxID=3082113 RepID=A0ACB0E001_RANTA|nr:unnamed protein product [Rangifer tarandus platyrhynchus]